MSKDFKEFSYLIFVTIIVSLLVAFNIDQPFFWDKDILDSMQANWFLDTNFNLQLPDHFDPGHPPLMGLTLASLWMVFGKHLIVGHILMWFVGFGVIWQTKRICDYYFDSEIKGLMLVLIMAETALLSQIIIVSSDLVLAFSFLFVINSILHHRRFALFTGLLLLSLTNLRGMTTAFGIFFFNIYINSTKNDQISIWKLITPYILASIPSLAFLVFHYTSKGWLVMNENGPWAGCYEEVGLFGFLRNIVIFGWRMLDAGRLAIWLTAILIGGAMIKNHNAFNKHLKELLVLFIILLFISLPSALLSNMLIDNRYFLPIFITLSTLTGSLIQTYFKRPKLKKSILGILIAFIISGSFWIYPDHLSTCWSASLGHLPYYRLKNKMNEYINEKGIDKDNIGSYVPNISQEKYTLLNNSEFRYHLVNFNSNTHIFYSNVYNISDEDLEELKRNWKIQKQFDSYLVKVILYQKKTVMQSP